MNKLSRCAASQLDSCNSSMKCVKHTHTPPPQHAHIRAHTHTTHTCTHIHTHTHTHTHTQHTLRWALVAHSLPSLSALCQAVPPHTLAQATGDVQFVLTLAALSKLRLCLGHTWLQMCVAVHLCVWLCVQFVLTLAACQSSGCVVSACGCWCV